MKPNNCLILLLSLCFLSISCRTTCETPLPSTAVFGKFNGSALRAEDLPISDRMALYNAEKQLYDTAQAILENYYIHAWFVDYQMTHRLASIEDAKKEYYEKNVSVSEKEVAQFMADNEKNKQMQHLSLEERPVVVRRYLTQLAQAKADQEILRWAEKNQKIKLLAMEKPVSPEVHFNAGGHVYDQTLERPKVTLVEFADYQCPFCVKVHPEIEKILKTYKGQVQYVYRDFPLLDKHAQALPAAIAAHCAEAQNKFWDMHKLLFDRAPNDTLNPDKFADMAKELNLNVSEFKKCQNDPAQKVAINADVQEGVKVGVDATPTIYINGQKYDGYISYDGLKRAIDNALTDQ